MYNPISVILGDELSRLIYQMNIQINIMRSQIRHNLVNGSSEDKYFFEERGDEMLEGLQAIYNKLNGINEEVNALLYLLLNYSQTLIAYLYSKDKHYVEQVKRKLEHSIELIGKYSCKFRIFECGNTKLKMFIAQVYHQYDLLCENAKHLDSSLLEELKGCTVDEFISE